MAMLASSCLLTDPGAYLFFPPTENQQLKKGSSSMKSPNYLSFSSLTLLAMSNRKQFNTVSKEMPDDAASLAFVLFAKNLSTKAKANAD
jgi:hypothetical protein